MFLDEKGLRGKTEEKKVEVEESDLKKLLRMGRERLMKHGWWKGSYVGPGGGVCALGAIGFEHSSMLPTVLFEGSPQYRAAVALAGTLGYPEDALMMVAGWNDRKSTTFEDVISLFDRTIERVK